MTQPPQPPKANPGQLLLQVLKARFNIRVDKARDADIDDALRSGVEMNGPHLWVLMFAIVIASVGLNVNSTAIVIGAMLISPLMGPIMGVGYGIGIYDFELIRRSLANLGLAALLALLASAAYFAVTPLALAQSELLARTTPTLWDVLVAFFGGLAGIFAMTHKEKSTVIPGAAIATALMPPLCTAGFGLATHNWAYFFGALYLFAINCVFIAAASAIVVTAFRLPLKQFVDEQTARRVRISLSLAVILTLLPSLYLAYRLVGDEIFRSRAEQFVRREFEINRAHVVAVRVDAKSRQIEVTLVGDTVPETLVNEIGRRLDADGLAGATLRVFQSGEHPVDMAALKSSLLADLYRDSQLALDRKQEKIDQLRTELASARQLQARFTDIPGELHALYPQIDKVLLAEAPDWEQGKGWSKETVILVTVHTPRGLTGTERRKIEQWLRARLKTEQLRVIVNTGRSTP